MYADSGHSDGDCGDAQAVPDEHTAGTGADRVEVEQSDEIELDKKPAREYDNNVVAWHY